MPLQTEDISVVRRQAAGDTVCVSTVTRGRERPVDETLTDEREIERVLVDAAPRVRLVVKRRLILKEEVAHGHMAHATQHTAEASKQHAEQHDSATKKS